MSGTSDIVTRARSLAERGTFPSWLADLRARAQRELATATFPGRKTESWKYTSLFALDGSGALDHAALVCRDTVPTAALPAIDAWRVVLVNGCFDATQSSLPADGSLVVSSLVGLPDAEQAVARELLGMGIDARLPFSQLNDAAFADGLYVRVPKGASPAKPLHVVFHAAGAAPASSQSRLLVRVEEGASLSLVEQYTGNAAGSLANGVTAIDLCRDARLSHTRLQLDGHEQFHVGALHLRQHGGSHCDAWQLMSGGRLRRNDITCVMAGPGAELALKGVFLAGDGEHVDNQVRIEHMTPHGTSDQLFKGLAGGDGRAVFNGRIHIHPGAKQTSAELVNNNLLLSPDAEIDTKPELEIYNDDVKCAHGATVGQLNETGVFYLQSRGIARADAELMLSLGFINELVDTVPLPALADWVRGEFGRWFAARGRAAGGVRK